MISKKLPEPEPARARARPVPVELVELQHRGLPLAFVVEPAAFNEDEQRRALSFLRAFEAEQAVSASGVAALSQSFTPSACLPSQLTNLHMKWPWLSCAG